jgi:hypothetical protein
MSWRIKKNNGKKKKRKKAKNKKNITDGDEIKGTKVYQGSYQKGRSF